MSFLLVSPPADEFPEDTSLKHEDSSVSGGGQDSLWSPRARQDL